MVRTEDRLCRLNFFWRDPLLQAIAKKEEVCKIFGNSCGLQRLLAVVPKPAYPAEHPTLASYKDTVGGGFPISKRLPEVDLDPQPILSGASSEWHLLSWVSWPQRIFLKRQALLVFRFTFFFHKRNMMRRYQIATLV